VASGADEEVPRGWPEGASCREKTARFVARAAAAGLPARHVVGVAWDGGGFAWHEWAEVFTSGAWLPVDPSFRQLPAEGPRFVVARFAEEDPPARQAAGRAILACWGRARVERAR
jgi:transglutaminase-like putative cysteine protease